MTASAVLIEQRRVTLGSRLGKGGEGEVFSLDHDDSHAVKLYTVSDLVEREQKIEAMIRSGMALQAPQVAFPLSVARDEAGRFAGFLMRNVLEHKPLHELYSPGSRKIHFPQADYRFLIRTAQNISKAIASVHTLGCVIGDINQSSILVSKAATVALIDSDSFQVTSGSQTFFCRVGVPEYTPPELQGVSLARIPRTANHDAFGLAIVIFQLLFMGRHPFVGTVRRGEIPTLYESIKDFRFVYSEQRDVGMSQPPGTPALSDFPKSMASAFESAFGSQSSAARPTAQQWIDVLGAMEESLTQCAGQRLHWYPAEASECPWCAMEGALAATLFIPFVPASERTLHAFDPGAGGFNLPAVWQQIAAFPQSTIRWLPMLPPTAIQPSKGTRFAKWKGRPYLDKLKRQHFEVEQRWLAALSTWRARTGVAAIEELLLELRSAKSTYENLAAEERTQLQAYERKRRALQLHAYLDGFEIRRANIHGMGPAEEVALASFGIDTAADVVERKLLHVPAFNHGDTTGLLSWRTRLERHFVYDAKENDLDRAEVARIRIDIENKAAMLRRILLAGRTNLDSAANRVSALMANKDPELTRLHDLRAQLRADLQYLGVDLKTLTALAANSSQMVMTAMRAQQASQMTAPPSTANARARSHAQAGVSCPRCGSQMVSRIANNGGSPGQQFWSCSRYPLCKGAQS